MEDGAIIHVDYDLFSGETGDLIETTREEVAKEHEMLSLGGQAAAAAHSLGTPLSTCLLYTSPSPRDS